MRAGRICRSRETVNTGEGEEEDEGIEEEGEEEDEGIEEEGEEEGKDSSKSRRLKVFLYRIGISIVCGKLSIRPP
jgi:hypothetical protein